MARLECSTQRVEPCHRLVPHLIENLVKQDCARKTEDEEGAPGGAPCNEGERCDDPDQEECMAERPRVVQRLREED